MARRPYSFAMTATVFSQEGQWLATADKNGFVQLWEVKTGQKAMDFFGNFNLVIQINLLVNTVLFYLKVGSSISIKLLNRTTIFKIKTQYWHLNLFIFG